MRWPVLLIGGSLLAALAYLVWVDPLPSAESAMMGKPAPVQAAAPASSEVPGDKGDCTNPNSARLSPFGPAQGACMSGTPSEEVLASSEATDQAELTQGITYEVAFSVLNVKPDAPAHAYGEWQKCQATEEPTEQRAKECEQLWKVMPYITLGLDTESKQGSTKASMLMADYYASVLFNAEPSTWQHFLGTLDEYAAKVGQSYPQEMSALLERVKPYRTQ